MMSQRNFPKDMVICQFSFIIQTVDGGDVRQQVLHSQLGKITDAFHGEETWTYFVIILCNLHGPIGGGTDHHPLEESTVTTKQRLFQCGTGNQPVVRSERWIIGVRGFVCCL